MARAGPVSNSFGEKLLPLRPQADSTKSTTPSPCFFVQLIRHATFAFIYLFFHCSLTLIWADWSISLGGFPLCFNFHVTLAYRFFRAVLLDQTRHFCFYLFIYSFIALTPFDLSWSIHFFRWLFSLFRGLYVCPLILRICELLIQSWV